jgi:hypothetical protein
MYPELQKELATFQKRTPKSAASHKRNLKRIPLGVASNYRVQPGIRSSSSLPCGRTKSLTVTAMPSAISGC